MRADLGDDSAWPTGDLLICKLLGNHNWREGFGVDFCYLVLEFNINVSEATLLHYMRKRLDTGNCGSIFISCFTR